MRTITRRWLASFLGQGSTYYRWLFIACLAALGISLGVAGTVLFVRWQADRAARVDTLALLSRTSEELAQTLQSRRNTLTLLRDALDKAPELNAEGRAALATSTAEHVPHLIGNGWIQRQEPILWWVAPASAAPQELGEINRQIRQRLGLRNFFGMPSAMTLFLNRGQFLLVMIEPMRARANRSCSLVALFDLKLLLADFFKSTGGPLYSAQLLESDKILFRSGRRLAVSENERHPTLEKRISFQGMSWILEMQPAAWHPLLPIQWLNVVLVAVGLLAGSAILGIVVAAERLRLLATTDELTELSNRRFFLERWAEEVERAKRYQRALSCLMIDVNGFKRINDVLGHSMGDCVLKHVAMELKTHLRSSDILARFGGDEFIVALPETNPQQAFIVAEKLRALTIQGSWSHDLELAVHLSVGLGHLEKEDTPHQIIQKADENLYAKKVS